MKRKLSNNQTHNEKRSFFRVSSDDINVKLKAYKGSTDFDSGDVKNISAGGLLLYTKNELHSGEHYLLVIEFIEKGLKQSLKCMSKVSRVERNNGGYDVAYEFKWISKDDVKRINCFLKSHK
ncbi:PilZ domain-containing protein [Spirochaetota bacterium]